MQFYIILSALAVVRAEKLSLCGKTQLEAADECLHNVQPTFSSDTKPWKTLVEMVSNTLIPWLDNAIGPRSLGGSLPLLPQCFLFKNYDGCLQRNVFHGERCSLRSDAHRLIRVGMEPICSSDWLTPAVLAEFSTCYSTLRGQEAFKQCTRKFQTDTEAILEKTRRKSHCKLSSSIAEVEQCIDVLVDDHCDNAIVTKQVLQQILVVNNVNIAREEYCA